MNRIYHAKILKTLDISRFRIFTNFQSYLGHTFDTNDQLINIFIIIETLIPVPTNSDQTSARKNFRILELRYTVQKNYKMPRFQSSHKRFQLISKHLLLSLVIIKVKENTNGVFPDIIPPSRRNARLFINRYTSTMRFQI